MFREMRRKNQSLSAERCIEILKKATSVVLAVSGDDGYPYAVPLSFAYEDGKIYFHCALTGHKLDAIARNDRVSFCVIDSDQVVPAEFNTLYRSVIAFGRARQLDRQDEKRKVLELLAVRYDSPLDERLEKEIESQLERVCLVEIAIEHLTGKQSIELARREQV